MNNETVIDGKFLNFDFQYKGGIMKLSNKEQIKCEGVVMPKETERHIIICPFSEFRQVPETEKGDLNSQTKNEFNFVISTIGSSVPWNSSEDTFIVFFQVIVKSKQEMECIIKIKKNELEISHDVFLISIEYKKLPPHDVIENFRKHITRRILNQTTEVVYKTKFGILGVLDQCLKGYIDLNISEDDMNLVRSVANCSDSVYHKLQNDLQGVTEPIKGKLLDCDFEYNAGVMKISNGEIIRCTVNAMENGKVRAFKLSKHFTINRENSNDDCWFMRIYCNTNIFTFVILIYKNVLTISIPLTIPYVETVQIQYLKIPSIGSVENFVKQIKDNIVITSYRDWIERYQDNLCAFVFGLLDVSLPDSIKITDARLSSLRALPNYPFCLIEKNEVQPPNLNNNDVQQPSWFLYIFLIISIFFIILWIVQIHLLLGDF
jgi:hypothetical protein